MTPLIGESTAHAATTPVVTTDSLTEPAFATGDVIAGGHGGTILVFGPDGTPKGSLSTASISGEQIGMCFDGGGNLYSTNFAVSTVRKFNTLGQVVQYPWGGGFSNPESCVVDNQQHVFVSNVGSSTIREFDTAGTFLKSFAPAREDRGVDWIDLSGDQCTMLYTSEGPSIKAFDVCNNVQLQDFATALPAPCFALRILRNGEVAVACEHEVLLLSQTGSVVSTYSTASIGDTGNYLFAFNLTPDNSAFWTADYQTGDIFKVRLSDGAVLTHIVGSGGISGLAVVGEGGPVGKPLGPSETYGGGGLSGNNPHCNTKLPVDCATGNFWHCFTDVSVPGRGPALNLTRTYNAQNTASDSPFGHGWSSSYTDHLSVDSGSGDVTVVQENGSTATFHPIGGGNFTAPPRVFATLVQNGDGTYTFTRRKREIFTFSSTGLLTAGSDLNGYKTTLKYDGSGNLTTVTDPAGRQLTFTHDVNNHITSVTDPIGRKVSYVYSVAGDLTGVTDVGGGTTTFVYDASHRMTTMTDPRGGTLTNTYDTSDRVVSQTDPLGRLTTFAYGVITNGTETTITSPNGNVTVEDYIAGELTRLTKGFGTTSAATWTFAYDQYTLGVIATTDPNGNVTQDAYDPDGNTTSVIDPLGHTTTSTYNGFDEPLTVTDPLGVTTTYTYDSVGNLLTTSRPLIGTALTRSTTLQYADLVHPGDVTSLTDPDANVWQFTYDTNGDLVSSTDPVGDKTTYAYDTIGRRTSMVSPRGNALGANPAEFTTTFTYNAFGDLLTTTDPLGHTASNVYDADRNRTSATDPNGRVTSSVFDADNELTKVNRADGTSLSYSYDGDGNQISQIDGAGHTTSYTYDSLDRQVSSTDPLARTTSFTYDGAGNRLTVTDASGRVTTDTYDVANELTGVTYSDGTTPNVTYGYDADSQQTSMTDGTGTTSFVYDSLHRLTSSTSGAGATVGDTYDLVGNLTGLTYPSAQTVTRAYDNAGHLTGVTDWLGHTTTFTYNPDANLTGENYANGVSAAAAFNNADQLTSITDAKSATTLSSFTYGRDNSGQLTSDTSTGVSASPQSYGYTALDQLASQNGSNYGYDHADNLTQLSNGTTQTYDVANELLSSTPPGATSSAAPTLDQFVSGDEPHFVVCNEANEAHRRSDQRDCVGSDGHRLLGMLSGFKTTTRAINLKANELVLAFVTSDGPNPNVKLSSGGLTWTRVAQAARPLLGDTEIWQTYTTAAVRTPVTASLTSLGLIRSLTVASFQGAGAKVGAVASGNGGSGKPTALLTTSNPNSLVWAVGHNWALRRMSNPTPNSGQHIVYSDREAFDSSWVQRSDVVATKGTGINVGDSAPTKSAWAFAAVEVLGAATTSAGSPTSYVYDKQGNRVSSTVSGGTTTNLTYDQANRLIGFGSNATYSYNGDGLRQSKAVSAVTTAFVWDLSQGTPLVIGDGSDYYVYGPGAAPLEKITGTTVLFLQQDQQGSTRVLTDSTGAVAGTYSYDPYGNVTSHTGTAVTTLQYDGQYTDAESGFQYLRARYYDPSTGQFVGVDPAFSLTGSRYSFAGGNPGSFDDPLGLASSQCSQGSGFSPSEFLNKLWTAYGLTTDLFLKIASKSKLLGSWAKGELNGLEPLDKWLKPLSLVLDFAKGISPSSDAADKVNAAAGIACTLSRLADPEACALWAGTEIGTTIGHSGWWDRNVTTRIYNAPSFWDRNVTTPIYNWLYN